MTCNRRRFMRCDLNESEHLIRQPMRLPCKRTACLMCIQRLAVDPFKRFIHCPMCNRRHLINDLTPDRQLEMAFDEHLPSLFDHMLNKLKETNAQLLERDQETIVNNFFDHLTATIDLRVESLKIQLDQIESDFFNMLDRIVSKQSTLDLLKPIEKESDDGTKSIRKLEDLTMAYANICQSKSLFTFKSIDQMIDSFRSNRIGQICLQSPFRKYFVDKIPCDLKLFKLDFNPNHFCVYQRSLNSSSSSRFILSDTNRNRLSILNSEFVQLKEIHSIDSFELKSPKSIEINHKNQLCLVCDANKLILINENLDRIEFSVDASEHDEICDVHAERDGNFLCVTRNGKKILRVNQQQKQLESIEIESEEDGHIFVFNSALRSIDDDSTTIQLLALNVNKKSIRLVDLNMRKQIDAIKFDVDGEEINSLRFDSITSNLLVHVTSGPNGSVSRLESIETEPKMKRRSSDDDAIEMRSDRLRSDLDDHNDLLRGSMRMHMLNDESMIYLSLTSKFMLKI